MSDYLGDPDLEGDPDADPPPLRPSLAPALAVAAVLTAFATFSGYALLSGSAYAPIDYGSPDDASPRDQLLVAGLLGIGLCAVPLLLGLAALRRTRADDPAWTGHLARGAVVAAIVAAALKSVAAVAQYQSDGPGSGIT